MLTVTDPTTQPVLHKLMTQCLERNVDTRVDFKAIVALLNDLQSIEFNNVQPAKAVVTETNYNVVEAKDV